VSFVRSCKKREHNVRLQCDYIEKQWKSNALEWKSTFCVNSPFEFLLAGWSEVLISGYLTAAIIYGQ